MHKLKVLVMMFFRASPSYIFILVFSSLLSSAQIFMNVILPKYLIDEILEAKRPEYLIYWTAMIVGGNVIFTFINKTIERIKKLQSNKIENRLLELMSKKIMSTKFMYLEDPYYLDLKQRAIFAWRNQGALKSLIESISNIIKSIFTIAGLVAIMLTLDYYLVLGLVVGVILLIILRLIAIQFQMRFFTTLIPINRKYFYYVNLTSEIRYAKDIKLYDMAPMISQTFYQYNDQILNSMKSFFTKEGMVEGTISIIQSIQIFFVYLYIGYQVFLKYIGLGSFTMYVSSATSFSTSIQTLFDSLLGIYQNLSYLAPFVEFMELKDEKEMPYQYKLEEEIETIQFEHVSFSYPKSEQLVLDDISFSIHKGEKISIVGLNGAGKTTLIKLLCRLYTPRSGKIYINGYDLQEIEYESYIKQISAVFQDYKLFDFSIKNNIVTTNQEDKEKLDTIIQEVGLKEKVDSLPLGLESNLNKNFDLDGVEFSGGQAQKVAIARALYKDSSLVILDEPTSALDPISEADIYNNFNQLVKDKTAIYISHRMSSSVFCDKVLIIDGGKVKDYDTHMNLMKKQDSLYYKLFHTQAQNYQV